MFSHTIPADCDVCHPNDIKGNTLKRSPLPETTWGEWLVHFFEQQHITIYIQNLSSPCDILIIRA